METETVQTPLTSRKNRRRVTIRFKNTQTFTWSSPNKRKTTTQSVTTGQEINVFLTQVTPCKFLVSDSTGWTIDLTADQFEIVP